MAFFAAPFSPEIITLDLPITQLEALALLHVISALLPANPCNFIISISTDNLASQQVLSSGKGKEPLLCACARQLWLISAINNCELEIKQKPGVDLVLADTLSRSLHDPSMKSKADDLCATANLVEVPDILDFDLYGLLVSWKILLFCLLSRLLTDAPC